MKKNTFKKNGYVIVKNAISKDIAEIFTNYALFDEKQNFSPEKEKIGGGQVPNAHSKFVDPATEALLLYLQPVIEKYTGLNLYPTYSIYRIYRNGDVLYPHTDRNSCEISVTLCLGHSYANSEYKWPIFVDEKPFFLSPTDLLIYRGIDLKHWRNTFDIKKESWHVQAFFHYVDANGHYSNLKYDQRGGIGYPSQLNDKSFVNKVDLLKSPQNKKYILFTGDLK